MKFQKSSLLIFVLFLFSCNFEDSKSRISKSNPAKFEESSDSTFVVRLYYPSGELKALTTFLNESKHGLQKFYFENGNLMFQGRFYLDKEDGEHLYYDIDGRIAERKIFDKGLEDGVWEYFENGVLVEKLFYSKGKYIKSEIIK